MGYGEAVLCVVIEGQGVCVGRSTVEESRAAYKKCCHRQERPLSFATSYLTTGNRTRGPVQREENHVQLTKLCNLGKSHPHFYT